MFASLFYNVISRHILNTLQ